MTAACPLCGLPLDNGSARHGRYHDACYQATRPRRRRVEKRARTVSSKRLSKGELAIQRALYPEAEHLPPLPATRGDCADGPRPCPHVRCRYHLFLEVLPRTNAIKFNFPDLEIEDMAESCALDVADRGALTRYEIGTLMNLTHERVRQIEQVANRKVNQRSALHEFAEDGPLRRRLPLLNKPMGDQEEEEAA